jgi:uncharacterized damage-inducible protein DinB
MNQMMIEQMWDAFRQKYGVYLRLLDAIPADRYFTNPISGMRTPAELAVHISGSVVRDFAQGVAQGRITAHEESEEKVATELGAKPAIVAFAAQCFEQASEAVARIGDAELSAMVTTPWGNWPGWLAFQILSDEFVHHRGQLTAYARACGVEPPFIWDFEGNAAEYRPKAEHAASSGS